MLKELGEVIVVRGAEWTRPTVRRCGGAEITEPVGLARLGLADQVSVVGSARFEAAVGLVVVRGSFLGCFAIHSSTAAALLALACKGASFAFLEGLSSAAEALRGRFHPVSCSVRWLGSILVLPVASCTCLLLVWRVLNSEGTPASPESAWDLNFLVKSSDSHWMTGNDAEVGVFATACPRACSCSKRGRSTPTSKQVEATLREPHCQMEQRQGYTVL